MVELPLSNKKTGDQSKRAESINNPVIDEQCVLYVKISNWEQHILNSLDSVSVLFSPWKTKHIRKLWRFKSHLPVHIVTTEALQKVIWRPMKRFTLVVNHSAALSVTTSAQHQVIWRDMKEITLVINHTAAPSVTTNAQHQVIWRDMKKHSLVINHSHWW